MALVVVGALCLQPASAAAQWITGGVPVFHRLEAESFPRLVPDGSGGVVIACIDSSEMSVHVNHFDALGFRGWADDAVLSPGAALSYVLSGDGQGGARISSPAGGIEHVGPDAAVTPEVEIGSGPPAQSIALAQTDAAGGLLYALNYFTANQNDFLELGHRGVTSWISPFLDWSATTVRKQVLSLAADGSGGAYALVQSAPSAPYRPPYGELFRWTASGVAPGWPAGGRGAWAGVAAQAARLVPVSTSGDSGVFVLWQDESQRVFALHVRPDGGTRTSNPFALQILDGSSPTAIVNAVLCAGGGLLVGLLDYGANMAGTTTARLLAVDSNSTVTSDLAIPGTYSASALRSIISDDAGGAYVVWTAGAEGHVELRASRLTAEGHVATGWPADGVLIRGGAGARFQADAVVSGGKLFVAWEECAGEPLDVYLAQIAPDGTVPTRLGFESATFQGDRVRLLWRGDQGPQAAIVQRSSDGASWDALGTTDRDGIGRYLFDDAAPALGTRAAYRLASPTLTPLTDLAWVDAPSATHLALRGFVTGATQPALAFTLASASPAMLRLYDVLGRIVATQAIAGSAGAQQVTLESSLRSGVYLARLAQDAVSVTRRVVLLR